MARIGLVLGAGGIVGHVFHAACSPRWRSETAEADFRR
jgi:hypothetical protein